MASDVRAARRQQKREAKQAKRHAEYDQWREWCELVRPSNLFRRTYQAELEWQPRPDWTGGTVQAKRYTYWRRTYKGTWKRTRSEAGQVYVGRFTMFYVHRQTGAAYAFDCATSTSVHLRDAYKRDGSV